LRKDVSNSIAQVFSWRERRYMRGAIKLIPCIEGDKVGLSYGSRR